MRALESSIHKPFAIPTQINNLGVLILAYVVYTMNQQTGCIDNEHMGFLYFILYGSFIVSSLTLILSILYVLGCIDTCISRLNICGQVCITINALGIFIFGVAYHLIAMFYGVYQLYFETGSQCVQIEIFRKVNGMIYTVWLVVAFFYAFFLICGNRSRNAMDVHLLDT